MIPVDIWGKSPTEEDYLKAEAIGVDRKTVNRRITNQGWKLKRAISEPMPGRPRPELMKEMEKLGISLASYRERRRRGLSEYEAATRPPKQKFHKSKEYLKWESIAENNGITKQTFKVRTQIQNMSYEVAATEPIVSREERARRSAIARKENNAINTTLEKDKSTSNKRGPKPRDPYYHAAKEIALSNGITIGAFKNRILNGWSYEVASTTPMGQKTGRKKKEVK